MVENEFKEKNMKERIRSTYPIMETSSNTFCLHP